MPIIYRVWHADEDGHAVDWCRTRAEANAKERKLAEEGYATVTSLVNIPATRVGLCAWLNDNFSRDNG